MLWPNCKVERWESRRPRSETVPLPILRRLGRQAPRMGRRALPPYFDHTYGCGMEVLRFDSRKPRDVIRHGGCAAEPHCDSAGILPGDALASDKSAGLFSNLMPVSQRLGPCSLGISRPGFVLHSVLSIHRRRPWHDGPRRIGAFVCGCEDTERRRAAETATFQTTQRFPVILRPGNVAEVQEVVRIASDFGRPLYPVSSGKNWGYGSGVPVRERLRGSGSQPAEPDHRL